MSDPPRPDHPIEIPTEVEFQILEILDATDQGAARDAAIRALDLAPEMGEAVTLWLQGEDGDEAEGNDFLASPTISDHDPIPSGDLPRRLGDYELESVLGKGGMGIVYRAHDLRLGRIVALKVLPERFADDQKRRKRFKREILAVAALRHPGIVPVFAADQVGDVPYYTMELVGGRAVNKVIETLSALNEPVEKLRLRHWNDALGDDREGSSTDSVDRTYLEAVCHLVISVADALQHAHDNGVTHRDVKPSNIIAEGGGRAKLFDFGLARLDDDMEMTRSSELIGSPHYMSPEQVESKVVDHRTDIYSLGVTLYELLTLKVPFEISSPQQIYQMIVHREPQRPGLINTNLPGDLETICLTAIEKDPERRFQSAGEFAEDLRRFLRFEPIHARPIGSVTRSLRWLRRNRMPASLVLLIVVALAALFFVFRSGKRVEAAESKRDTIQLELDELQEKRTKARAELERITRLAETTNAELVETDLKLKSSNDEIDQQRKTQETLRGENSKLTEKTQALEKKEKEQKNTLNDLKTSRDKLVTNSNELRQQIDVQSRTLVKANANLEIAEKDLGTLRQSHRVTTINKLLMEARTLRGSNTGLGLILAHEAAKLSNDLATADSNLQARVDNTLLELLRTTQERRTFTGHGHPVTAIDFSPSGATVVSTSSDGVVYLWQRETGNVLAKQRLRAAIVHAEFIAEDRLLLAQENGDILTWNGRGDTKPRRLVNALHQPQTRRHCSPDGKVIVSHIEKRPSQLIVHYSDRTQPERNLGTAENPIVDFEFSPVNDLIIATTTHHDLQLWNIRTGELERNIPGSAAVLSATFDAQGRRIASLDATGTVRVIDVADASVLLAETIDDGSPLGAGRVAFCAGDRRLFVSATGLTHNLFLDPRNGHVIGRIPAGESILGFHLDRKRELVCIADTTGGFDVVNTHNGQTLAHLGSHAALGPRRHRPVAAFDPDGSSLATVYGETKARIWRTRPGGALRTVGPGLAGDPIGGGAELLQFGRFETDNGRVLVASNVGLSSWHLATGKRRVLDHDARRTLVPDAISADGRGIVYADGMVRILLSGPRPTLRDLLAIEPQDVDQVLTWPGDRFGVVLSDASVAGVRTLRLVDASGRETGRHDLPAGRAGGGTPRPSPDGSRYLIGYDNLSIVDLANPSRSIELPFSRVPAAFSPDGERVATSTGFSVKVWNARSGATWCELTELPNDDSQLTCIAFFPDGRRIATGWSDGMIRVHDCQRRTARKLYEITAHRERVHSLAFDQHGTLLVSTSSDGTARVWRTADPKRPPLTFAPGESCVHAEFRSDGKEILVVCPRALHTFPLDLRRLARRSCPRELTAAERLQFGLVDQRR